MRAGSKRKWPTPSAGKRTRPSRDWFWFSAPDWLSRRGKSFLTNQIAKQSKTKKIQIIFDTIEKYSIFLAGKDLEQRRRIFLENSD